uniref:Uncharacterized protein n=1 Tax=Arundo donax TaxID=35708 RepID=A0A0A9FG42_ARUDO
MRLFCSSISQYLLQSWYTLLQSDV